MVQYFCTELIWGWGYIRARVCDVTKYALTCKLLVHGESTVITQNLSAELASGTKLWLL